MTDMVNTVEEVVSSDPYKKVYYSDIVGTSILDAITGVKYPYKVGSKDEKKFFKVRTTVAYKNRSAKLQIEGLFKLNAITQNIFWGDDNKIINPNKPVLALIILTGNSFNYLSFL